MISVPEVLLLFAIGSIFGYLYEQMYYIRNKKIKNPGFLKGPYSPLYGFGILFLYGISVIPMHTILKIILFVASTTLLELVVGLFFTKVYKIKLWDYSKAPFNYKGIISVIHSSIWAFFALIFYFFVFPALNALFTLIKGNLIFYVVLMVFYIILLTDVYKSFNAANKIKKGLKRVLKFTEYGKERKKYFK